jgi:hypothetical protein
LRRAYPDTSYTSAAGFWVIDRSDSLARVAKQCGPDRPTLQLARGGADRERRRWIPALAGQRASLAVRTVGEDGSVPVEQFPRRDELRGVGGAGEGEQASSG